MAITAGSISATTTPSFLCVVPAGRCLVTISNDSASAGSAFVGPTPSGTAAALTSSNGIPVPSGQVVAFVNFPSSAAVQFSVVATTTAKVGYLISSADQ